MELDYKCSLRTQQHGKPVFDFPQGFFIPPAPSGSM